MGLRLLQRRDANGARSVIAANGDHAALVPGVESVRALAIAAIAAGRGLAEEVAARGAGTPVDPAAELAAGPRP